MNTGVEITLDKPRRLVYDFNALSALEDQIGKSALEEATWAALSAKDIRAFVWAGLLADDPEITLVEVGAMLDVSNLDYLGDKLSEAFGEALKKPGAESSPLDQTG